MNINKKDYNINNGRLMIKYNITFDNAPGVLCKGSLNMSRLTSYFAIYCYENYKSLPICASHKLEYYDKKTTITHYSAALSYLDLYFNKTNELYFNMSGVRFMGSSLELLLATLLADIKEFKKSNKPKKELIDEYYELKYLDEEFLMMKCNGTELKIPLSSGELKGLRKTKNDPFYFADHILRIENTIRIRRHNKQRLVIYKFSPSLLDKFYSISAEL